MSNTLSKEQIIWLDFSQPTNKPWCLYDKHSARLQWYKGESDLVMNLQSEDRNMIATDNPIHHLLSRE